MRDAFLEVLVSPETGAPLKLAESAIRNDDKVEQGHLYSDDGTETYRVVDGIPRFVDETNYADNFGLQWNHFRQIQLDSFSGLSISADRFWAATGWDPKMLEGKWVLDAGCGAGRFAEVALSAGANVVALDYSSAVDACSSNLAEHPNLHLVQADIFNMPFKDGFFDFIYSLGVLQHTPNVRGRF